MALNKFFRFPFATTGDKTAVPDTTDPSGFVSYEQGYGFDYQRDPTSDPLAKNIERDKMNQILADVTTALREYQIMGTPDFIEAAQNGGVAFSYSKNARVRYDGGSGFKIYQSLVDANTALPTVTANWQEVVPFDVATYTASTAEAQAQSNNTRFLTPLRLAEALQGANQSFATNGYQKLPGGLILQWGFSTTISTTLSSITFPIAFPSACIHVGVQDQATVAASAIAHGVSGFTTTKFDVVAATTAGTTAYWFAIGY